VLDHPKYNEWLQWYYQLSRECVAEVAKDPPMTLYDDRTKVAPREKIDFEKHISHQMTVEQVITMCACDRITGCMEVDI
jgi:hypothetical protein